MIRVRKEAIQKDRIEPYFEQWENLSKEIYAAHDERDSKKAKNLMEQGIALFEELMVNTSDTDVEELLVHEEYEGMPFKIGLLALNTTYYWLLANVQCNL